MLSRRTRFVVLVSISLCVAGYVHAESVVDRVPQDALGYVLVRNLSQADGKIAKTAGDLRVPLPTPLTMVKSLTGISAGLDADRELLLVALPPENESRPFHVAVWLPVKDYDALVRSLEGDPQRRIAAATIAGEDVLIAHVGEWAVVMDPDQQDRLKELTGDAAAAVRPHADATPLIDRGSDLSLVVQAAGMEAAGRWLAAVQAAAQPADDEQAQTKIVPLQSASPNDNSWRAVWQSTQSMLADAQELKRLAIEAQGFGCSLRWDESGNALVKFKALLSPDAAPKASSGSTDRTNDATSPRLYDGGPFVLNGSAQVSERWTVPFVAPYARQMAADLASEYNTKVDDADLAKFRRAVEQVVAQVRTLRVLWGPGGDQDGVYSNSFLALQVPAADQFLKRVKAAVDEWNAMLGKVDGAIGLIFEDSPISGQGYEGTEYSIDMAKAVGAGSLPEARQSMERLFGSGGRFRIQSVKVDDTTVLLAIASQDQLEKPIRAIHEQRVEATDDGKVQSVVPLLARESDWRLFLSLDGYNHWTKRQMEAIVGPVIGGPIVRPFPASPPIGAAGGVAQNIVWAEVAVPAETLRGIGKFFHP